VLLAGLLAAATLACGRPASTSSPAAGAATNATRSALTATTYHAAAGGGILLKDAAGDALAPGSTAPYSPEKTCGGCHDVATITQGYHFQQGRTNADRSMRVSDSFNPKKPWLLSDGMYGKT
jgi:hypothetical protein